MDDKITVLISTSPIRSHPSTEIIDECIASIRKYLNSDIIIMADGVRPEQEKLREPYEEFLTRLQKKYSDLVIVKAQEHLHQARMTKLTVPMITTPLLFFMEHDFVIYDEIPMQQMAEIILSKDVNLIRLMLDAQLIEGHKHMMLGEEVIDGLRLTRTKQWSQRPHLATTELYSRLMKLVPDNSHIMLEDLLHGLVGADYDITGQDNYRLYIYTPDGDTMQRVRHLDGRGEEPKYEMDYGN